jgi:hypothetical protein
MGKMVDTKAVLRPGDVIDFVTTASDPEGLELEYAIRVDMGNWSDWQRTPAISLTIERKHIGQAFVVGLHIRSARDYHAMGRSDDRVDFWYKVLPAPEAR